MTGPRPTLTTRTLGLALAKTSALIMWRLDGVKEQVATMKSASSIRSGHWARCTAGSLDTIISNWVVGDNPHVGEQAFGRALTNVTVSDEGNGLAGKRDAMVWAIGLTDAIVDLEGFTRQGDDVAHGDVGDFGAEHVGSIGDGDAQLLTGDKIDIINADAPFDGAL